MLDSERQQQELEVAKFVKQCNKKSSQQRGTSNPKKALRPNKGAAKSQQQQES